MLNLLKKLSGLFLLSVATTASALDYWDVGQHFGNWTVEAMRPNGKFTGCAAYISSFESGLLVVAKGVADNEMRMNHGDWAVILPKTPGISGNTRFQTKQFVGVNAAPMSVSVEVDKGATPIIKLGNGAGVFNGNIARYAIFLNGKELYWDTSSSRAAMDTVNRCFAESAPAAARVSPSVVPPPVQRPIPPAAVTAWGAKPTTTPSTYQQQANRPAQPALNWSQPQNFGNWKVAAMSENGQFQGCVAALQGGAGLLLVGKFMANAELRLNRGDWAAILPKVSGVIPNNRVQTTQQLGANAPSIVWVESDKDANPFIRLGQGPSIFGIDLTNYQIWIAYQGLSWATAGSRAATGAVTRCFNDSAR